MNFLSITRSFDSCIEQRLVASCLKIIKYLMETVTSKSSNKESSKVMALSLILKKLNEKQNYIETRKQQ